MGRPLLLLAAVLAVTAAAPAVAAGEPLTVELRRAGDHLVAEGTGPDGVRVEVRLLRAGKVVGRRRAVVRDGRYAVRFQAATRVAYRVKARTLP